MADETDGGPDFVMRDATAEVGSRDALPIDFSTFVISLGNAALYHLGLVPDPETGKPTAEPNLVLVRQTIDTLEMLERKTRGNLDDDESHLLGSLLYELRMRFVEATKGDSGEPQNESP